jgi:hypothetical protein
MSVILDRRIDAERLCPCQDADRIAGDDGLVGLRTLASVKQREAVESVMGCHGSIGQPRD